MICVLTEPDLRYKHHEHFHGEFLVAKNYAKFTILNERVQ